MKIIVTGSLAFDFIMDFPGRFGDHILPEKIHEINLSFLVKTLKKQRGGTAGNIAYNLALLGLKPTILATAGYDFADYKNELDKVGVNTLMIYIIKAEPTASAFIFTDQADNQITGFYPGAMKQAKNLSLIGAAVTNCKKIVTRRPLDIRAPRMVAGWSEAKAMTPPRWTSIFVVISPNEPSAMMNFVKECRELRVDYMFDPGMQLPRLSDKDLKLGIEGAKIVIGNDYEMALITTRLKDTSSKAAKGHPRGVRSTPRAVEELAADQIWITTLGEKGSIIEAGGKKYLIPPAKPEEVLDPTGAGDAYRAGFLAGFLRGLPPDVCGRMGSVCAVYTVEKYGTQTHKFTLKEFKKRYQENFKDRLEVR